MSARIDEYEEIVVEIPKADDVKRTCIQQKPHEEIYETNLGDINDLIKDLSQSLDINEPRGKIYSDPAFSPYSAKGNESEPLAFPEAWWDIGVRYGFEWVKEIFLSSISSNISRLLHTAGIMFFTWRSYDTQVTMEASSCSLALMLKPWTPTDSGQDANDDSIYAKNAMIHATMYHDIPWPSGVSDKKLDTSSELSAMIKTCFSIVQQMQDESTRVSRSNAILAETLSAASNTMKTILTLQDKEYHALQLHRKDTRREAIKAAKSTIIIERWILDQSINKVKSRISEYRIYKREIDEEEKEPLRILNEQKDKFKSIWKQIKFQYEQFLKQENISDEDDAASNAMDIMIGDSNDFTIDSVRLLRNYINYMKRISYENTLHKETSIGSKSNNPSNPITRLNEIYEKKKSELEDIDKQLREYKSLKINGADVDTKIADLEKKRESISKIAQDSIRILENYKEFPSDSHNRWLSALDRLESSLEKASQEWDRILRNKYRKEAELEEEIKASLYRLMNNTYASYDSDLQRILVKWNDRQSILDKKRDEDMTQISMEKNVAENWLNTCERKLTQLIGLGKDQSGYLKKIAEFRALQNMISAHKESMFKMCEFEEAYRDLVYLWKTIYSFSMEDRGCG